jgi:hypothetical protein
MNTKQYPCPICKITLIVANGSQVNPNDGITLYCGNLDCTAQEVMGHGTSAEKAFDIITEKYKITK